MRRRGDGGDEDLVAAINSKVGTNYAIWRIGLTHDPAESKRYWGETARHTTAFWSHWQADSLSNAQATESHFIGKGMKGGTGGDLSPDRAVYVYVF
jgi:hypothetical protein